MKKIDKNQLLRWFAKQPEEILLQTMAHMFEFRMAYINDCRRDNKKLGKDPLKELGFLLASIEKAYRQSDIKTLSIFDDLEQIDANRLAAALAKKQRRAPKRKAVVEGLREVVERLRSEGLSWAGVSDYIALNHKKRVSRGYLQKLFAVKF